MKALIVGIIGIMGIGMMLASAVIGGLFSWTFFKGYIGTNGNEAGRELLVMLLLTVTGIALGWLMLKTSQWLSHKSHQQDNDGP